MIYYGSCFCLIFQVINLPAKLSFHKGRSGFFFPSFINNYCWTSSFDLGDLSSYRYNLWRHIRQAEWCSFRETFVTNFSIFVPRIQCFEWGRERDRTVVSGWQKKFLYYLCLYPNRLCSHIALLPISLTFFFFFLFKGVASVKSRGGECESWINLAANFEWKMPKKKGN